MNGPGITIRRGMGGPEVNFANEMHALARNIIPRSNIIIEWLKRTVEDVKAELRGIAQMEGMPESGKPLSNWTRARKDTTLGYFYEQGKFWDELAIKSGGDEEGLWAALVPTGHTERPGKTVPHKWLYRALVDPEFGVDREYHVITTDPKKVAKIMGWLHANYGDKVPREPPEGTGGVGIRIPKRPIWTSSMIQRIGKLVVQRLQEKCGRHLRVVSESLRTGPTGPTLVLYLDVQARVAARQ